MFSPEQALFYTTAVACHSVLLIGKGGGMAGKTFVLDKVAKDWASWGKNVPVTCSKGIAATRYICMRMDKPCTNDVVEFHHQSLLQ